MLYIYYLILFKKNNKAEIQALIDSGNEINVIIRAYMIKLRLKI